MYVVGLKRNLIFGMIWGAPLVGADQMTAVGGRSDL
jgi:hypothetical protein